MIFTSKDLLYKVLDYDGLWNTSKQMLISRPSQIRLLQIEKLFAGFGIAKTNARSGSQIKEAHRYETVYSISGHLESMDRFTYLKSLTDVQYFTTGEFISDLPTEIYHDLTERIISTSKTIFPDQAETIDKESVRLNHLFSDLYGFRLSLYHLTNAFARKRINTFSPGDDYALYLRNRFFASLQINLSEIDEILCTLIDPEKKSLREEDINYPEDDLKAIDDNWQKQRKNNDNRK